MAIRFINIRSGEEVVAEEEPHISALWSSSDHSPNITQGQDFGWRLAPSVLVEMKEIKQNPQILQTISITYQRPLEDIGEPDILTYISDKTNRENAPVADEADYTDFYDQEVRRLTKEQIEAKKKAALEAAQIAVQGTDTKESLEDLQRRVELEERLAAARAVPAQPVSEVETATTTTTTTAVPKTTSPPAKK